MYQIYTNFILFSLHLHNLTAVLQAKPDKSQSYRVGPSAKQKNNNRQNKKTTTGFLPIKKKILNWEKQ